MTDYWVVMWETMTSDEAPNVEIFLSYESARCAVLDLHDMYIRTTQNPGPLSITQQTPGVHCYLFGDDEWCYLYHNVEVTP
jgi:hypothetical protein